MSASQRRKGASGEREVVHLLQETLGVDCNRNLEQTRDGGFDIALGKFRIEVKRRKSISVHKFMDQASASCKQGEYPIVFMRGDGKDWLVMMNADVALRLLGNEL